MLEKYRKVLCINSVQHDLSKHITVFIKIIFMIDNDTILKLSVDRSLARCNDKYQRLTPGTKENIFSRKKYLGKKIGIRMIGRKCKAASPIRPAPCVDFTNIKRYF